MAYREARATARLLAQLNALAPNRSKLSDGWIASANHTVANPNSDHEPWVLDGATGVVTARDFTNNPAGGLDCEVLYQALVKSRDPRIKYVIWNKTITSGAGGPQPWVRRAYTGTNPHDKHLHMSVRSDKASYDDARDWAVTPQTPEADMPLNDADLGKIEALIQKHVETHAQRVRQVVSDGQRAYGLDSLRRKLDTLLGKPDPGPATVDPVALAAALKAQGVDLGASPSEVAEAVVSRLGASLSD